MLSDVNIHAARTAGRGRRPILTLLLLLASVTLGACSGVGRPVVDSADQPVLPAVDQRAHRYLVLDNGMRALLVSDPATDKAAAALAVDAGSFAEPADRQGIAHFLEHMLFLGTEKYPEPDEYGQFISTHGGSRNAYTSLDHTNYFFDISADQLYEALDRFSQFFAAPLFTSAYVDREKNAVNSEYQLQMRDDGWRTYMTQKRALNPEHPGSRFTIGSLDTLADRNGASIRDDLLRFYDNYYSADRMALVIVGREDLDTLQQWAVEFFGPVPQRQTLDPEPEAPVLAAAALPQLQQIQPVQERRVLEISFALPPLDAVYDRNPGGYLANMIGHEGEGSLHAMLRDLGWIESLGSSASRFGEHNALLEFRVGLTPEGLQHWPEIGTALFAYIDELRAAGIGAERFDEQSRLNALNFNYQEQTQPYGYVRYLASNMLVYPPADTVRGPFAMDVYDPELLQRYLDALRPELAAVTLTAPEAETDQIEPWFDVPYSLTALPEEILTQWQDPPAYADLQLPEPNPFIPEDLSLLAGSDSTPAALVNEPGFEVWSMRDTSFDVPRAVLRLELRSDAATDTARGRVLASLYTSLVNDALNTYSYPAMLAGLSYSLQPGSEGLQLTVRGYNDRQAVLLDRVLGTMTSLQIDPDRFEHFRAEGIRDLRNLSKERPYQQTMAALRRATETAEYEPDTLIASAQAVSVEELEAWQQRMLGELQILALFHGNLGAGESRDLVATLRQYLDTGTTALNFEPELVRLQPGQVLSNAIDIEHNDAAIAMYVQGRDQSYPERARFGLLAHMMSSDYFNDMRTEKQLGYVVFAGAWVRLTTPGAIFVVQSPVAPAGALENFTFEFLDNWGTKLDDMTAEAFEDQRAGLLARILERDQNLAGRSARLWSDLDDGITSFDSRERLATAVRALSLDDMRRFYPQFQAIARDRRMMAYTPGQFEGRDVAPSGQPVEDTRSFKIAQPKLSVSSGRASGGR